MWFALVIAYGLGQRDASSGRDPVAAGSPPSVAVPTAASAAETRSELATSPTVVAPPAPAAEGPVAQASPPATEAQAAAPARAPAPAGAPRSTTCDAVADVGTVEPGSTLAFRLDPRCPYRPGTVDIAINGEPPRPAQVDENGVVWVDVGE